MKTKNSVLVETANTLAALKPLTKAPKATFAFSKNLRKLKDGPIKELEADRVDLVKVHLGELNGEPDKTHPGLPAFYKAYQEELDKEVEFEPHKCSESDLNLEENTISARELSVLLWLLNEDGPKA